MKRSVDYLESALEKLGDISDAKKAEALKISKQALSGYKSGDRVMDDFACIMVAKVLNIYPLEVIAAANSDREKSKERKGFWEDFRKTLGQKLGVAGLAMTMAMAMMGTPTPAKASLIYEKSTQHDIYIMSNLGDVASRCSTQNYECFLHATFRQKWRFHRPLPSCNDASLAPPSAPNPANSTGFLLSPDRTKPSPL